MQSFLSISWDKTIKMVQPEFSQRIRTLGSPETGPEKSLFSFDFSPRMKSIATCGADREVYLWNPWISRPIFKLECGTCTQVWAA